MRVVGATIIVSELRIAGAGRGAVGLALRGVFGQLLERDRQLREDFPSVIDLRIR